MIKANKKSRYILQYLESDISFFIFIPLQLGINFILLIKLLHDNKLDTLLFFVK